MIFKNFDLVKLNMKTKSPGGFELVSTVHKPDTLTTEL